MQASQRRPLVVRLRNWVGDVVLGVPALQLLQAHGYDLQLVGRAWAPALLAAQGWPVHVLGKTFRARTQQLRALRQAACAVDPGFDRRPNALVLPTSFSSALDMRWAGLNAQGYAQEARGFLLQRSHPITYGGHALVSYWELASRFLGVNAPPPADIGLCVSPAQRQAAQAALAEHGVAGPYVVICPFAGGQVDKQDKTWPDFPAFARHAHAVLRSRGVALVVVPGPGSEVEVAQRDYPDAVSLPGVPLGVYNALLQGAVTVVSNDTGPAHMAAAVGASVVSVLGPTLPAQWAPWGRRVEIVRYWPRWPTVDEVWAPVALRLDGAP